MQSNYWQKQLELKAKEVSKKKSDAEDRLHVAENLLEKCKKVNAEVDDIQKSIVEASAALGMKDYDQAIDKAEKAVSVATNVFKERIHSILMGAEEIAKIISDVGEEPTSLNQMISDAKASLSKDDYETSIRLAEQTYDVSQKALHEHYSKAYSRAQQLILKAKEIGENVDDSQKDLRDTKTLIESEDYTAAITSVRTVLDTVSDMVRSHIATDIDSIEDGVLSAEDLGSDVSKLKEYISKARELLDSKDFDEAMSYARRAENECEKAVSGKMHDDIKKLREDVRTTKKHGGDVDAIATMLDTVTKSLKDKEIASATQNLEKAKSILKESQFKLVLQSISKSKDNFVLAKKLGLDIGKPIGLLNESREYLQKGSFEEAISSSEKAEVEIENVLSAFRNAQDGMEKLAIEIKKAEDVGISIPDDVNTFQEARNALTNRDFKGSNEKAIAGIDAIEKYLRKVAEEQILNAENLASIATKLGVDVSTSKEHLKSANELLAELDPIEAYKAAQESISSSNTACRDVMNDTISAVEAFLDDSAKSFDVLEYRNGLSTAKDLVESAQYVEAVEKIADVKESLEKRGAEECKRLVGDAEIKVGELEAAGIDASDLRLMMSRAEEAVKKGTYENAIVAIKEAIKDADASLEDVAQKTLFTLKSMLEDAKSDSIDTTKWRGLYKQAKDMLESGDTSSSYQISKKILGEISRFAKERQTIMTRIAECEELITEASRNKINVGASAQKVDEARNAMAELDLEKAIALISDAEKSVESTMGMYLAAKMIMSIKSSIEVAEREQIKIDPAKSSLEESKSFMKERRYDEALVAAKRAQSEISIAFKSKAESIVSSIGTLISDARNVGVDVGRTEKLLERARSELDDGDFENSYKSAILARDEIDQIRDLSSKSAVEIRIAKERMRDAEAIGIDMSQPRATLDQAVDSLNSHKYAIAFELARKVSSQVIENIKNNLQGLFQKISRRITFAEKDGLEVDSAMSLLEEAKKHFDSMAFQESIKLIMQCEQELDRADLQHNIASNSLEVAKKKIEEGERDLLVVSKAKTILGEAEEAMTNKQFSRVIELSIMAGDEIERGRHQSDGCRLDLNSLNDRLSRLNRVGLEIPAVEVLRQKAESAIQNAEFESCREICIDAERMITVELENIISGKLTRAEMLLDLGTQLGMADDKECHDMLEVAQTSAKEGLWDFAYEQTQKCSMKIEETIRERMYSAISDVRSKLSVVSKSGASVKTVEEELLNAEKKIEQDEFESGFKLVVDAATLLSKIESLHKDYLDAKYAAESAASIAKKFGIPTKESERLIAMAEIERDRDYSSAIDLLREATENSQNNLDKFNPDVSLRILPPELKQDQRVVISIDLMNKGKALAKDLKIKFTGSNLDIESIPEIAPIRPGESKRVDISVIPRRPGESELFINLEAKRVFDGKSFDFSTKTFALITPKEASARIARATEEAKCVSCSGKIKPGFDIVICNKCQGIEHLACAKRTKKCGKCGAVLDF